MIEINCSPKIDQEKTRKILTSIKNDPFGGWYGLPTEYNKDELENIKKAASEIQSNSEVLVCIGIGGSYLGHRALIEALEPVSKTKIIYAGNSLSRRELERALKTIENKDFSINVISKSGTTLEPSVAFEAFKEKLIQKYGEENANRRIYATTDANRGTLHDEAIKKGYNRFVVPDNIGGRYSVLSAVGLLPLAVAGINIDNLLSGAAEQSAVMSSENIFENPSIKYAWMRYELWKKGYDTEVFASFEPSTSYFNEWIKQLFGESEGKNQQGIFPASVIYSTDLHSMGQFMQDGRRNIFETIINYPTDDINAKAVEAVSKAHRNGGIPVLQISLNEYNEKSFGELIYFF